MYVCMYVCMWIGDPIEVAAIRGIDWSWDGRRSAATPDGAFKRQQLAKVRTTSMYVCMYVYISMYVCMYIHIHSVLILKSKKC